MARVLFIVPPYLDLYGTISKAAGRYFPLGIAYVAAYLRRYGGHEVAMLEPEAQGLTYEDIQKSITEYVPDVIGITSSTPNFPRAVMLARICRECSGARIVLGGVHASAVPESIIESYPGLFDCVVVGEGERTMLDVVEAFGRGEGLEGVRGVVYDRDGLAVRTPRMPFIDDLDSLPHPARDLMPQRLFTPNAYNARYRSCISMLTSRGCPYNCSFCAARVVSGAKYRMHSAGYVLDEMEMLKRDYGARQLLITDDTFTVNRARLEEICRGMIDRRLGLAWFCFSQVNTVDRESLSLMKRAGCYNIGFGVETADPEILRRMGKNIRPEQAVETVAAAKSLGIKTQAFYIFGSPGETVAQMDRTMEHAVKVDSTLAFFNMLVPYPGTKDFEYFFSGVPHKDIRWEDFVAVGENCVISRNGGVSREDIERAFTRAYMRYYGNPRRLLNILLQLKTPYELMRHLTGLVRLRGQLSRWSTLKRPPEGRTG